jgi:hypothetical protein
MDAVRNVRFGSFNISGTSLLTQIKLESSKQLILLSEAKQNALLEAAKQQAIS